MLLSLYIRDYALIDELDVTFEPGLIVLTGETGAGKSIVVGALKLALGERASKNAIRAGASKTVVEAHFECGENEEIISLLKQHQLDEQPVLIVRREVTPDYSRAFVNDSPSTIQVLRDITDRLIDLHGQHEHQSLLKTPLQLGLLTRYADAGGLADQYKALYDERLSLTAERGDLIERRDSLQQQRDLVEFQIQEIDSVAPEVEEESELATELRLLDNMERVLQTASELHHLLYTGDDAVYDKLTSAGRDLEELGRVDARFEPLASELESAGIVVSEVAAFLQDYASNVEFSQERHEYIRERLGLFDDLKRKYGGSIEAVLHHRETIWGTYQEAINYDGMLAETERRLAEIETQLGVAALALSKQLRSESQKLESEVDRRLARLGFSDAVFKVGFSRDETDADGIVLDDSDSPTMYRAFPTGVDRVEFLLTANAGEPLRPLANVASGGEVSRIMLALKSVLAGSDRVPTLVFDEIDSGISGAIAHRVGKALKGLADNHQIVVITHLPQIAALADVHFSVSKTTSDDRAVTRLSRLAEDERTREVAALLSGDIVTDAALDGARELIRESNRQGDN